MDNIHTKTYSRQTGYRTPLHELEHLFMPANVRKLTLLSKTEGTCTNAALHAVLQGGMVFGIQVESRYAYRSSCCPLLGNNAYDKLINVTS